MPRRLLLTLSKQFSLLLLLITFCIAQRARMNRAAFSPSVLQNLKSAHLNLEASFYIHLRQEMIST